ncbi:outer membrane beta-barrel protein [Leptobacterium flavescens]|uniref:Outer membrane beta-barrel protein n=1 Tax=Leptobacterium flavescens TaxID=472055 RepID=A0A6P0ULP3_9FLAO|nr:OmpW family outer membrane protein [Leptobacterium flavescens]NER13330.1 outer membrane beta-barrel protein [Leptobacterium flavescens]
MKKVLFGIFVLLAVFQLKAQDDGTSDFKRWQARLRLISVIPDEDATIQAIGGNADISTSYVPELDFTYFFTENWAAELILATTNHDVEAVATSAGNIDLGDVWLLPPTLSLQYHFTGGKLKPYLGAGINYTIFYGVDEGPAADDIDYDNAFGFSFQAGLDYELNDRWFLNFDIKKLFLQTDATINATTALGATVNADVDINPLIIGVGFGMKF